MIILDDKGMERARFLASEMVRLNNERKVKQHRLVRERSRQQINDSIATLSRVVGKASDVITQGLVKPILMALQGRGSGL